MSFHKIKKLFRVVNQRQFYHTLFTSIIKVCTLLFRNIKKLLNNNAILSALKKQEKKNHLPANRCSLTDIRIVLGFVKLKKKKNEEISDGGKQSNGSRDYTRGRQSNLKLLTPIER